MAERWLPVVGFEGLYEVSDQGRVRSLDRRVSSRPGSKARLAPGRILVADYTSYHGRVKLHRDGQPFQRTVHSLVAKAFIGPRPDGLVACHDDGDPRNNSATNLRYDTQSENLHDVVRHGHHYLANRTHCKRGHEFTAENTRRYRGRRSCRTCERIRAQGYIDARSLARTP